MNPAGRTDAPLLAVAADVTELTRHYAFPPQGVRANMVFSADGAAAIAGRVQGLTCPADQRLLEHLRGYADVVLVGAATARAEGYGPVRLSAEQKKQRHTKGYANPPRIAVVSLSGQLPASLYDSSGPPPILITSDNAAAMNNLCTDERRQVLVAGKLRVDVRIAVALLRQAGLHRILCEGGPTLLDEITRADLLDEICVTIAPRLAGAQPVGSPPIHPLTLPVGIQLRHALVHHDYLFLRYSRLTVP